MGTMIIVMPHDVQLISEALIASVLEQARESPRRRTNFNFHPSMNANPHRFLNVMLEGTYIQPHRHLNPPKSETFLVLEGEALIFLFDEEGSVTESHTLGSGEAAIGIDIAPGVWHSLAVLSPYAVCFEVKPGPYLQASDKEFAEWAPREGDVDAGEYLRSLLEAHGFV